MDLLVIKSLTIKDFEDISFFEASFDPDYVMLDMPEAETVAKAVSVILKSVRMQNFSDELHITTGTFMSAEVDINGETFFVTAKGCPEKKGFTYEVKGFDGRICRDFYNRIYISEEEDRLSWFCYDPKDPYSKRLMHYKDPEKYYPEGDFTGLTDGIGCTRTFRAMLSEHMKEFKPFTIPGLNWCHISLKSDGSFVLDDRSISWTNIKRYETERNRIFEFMCYLSINGLWADVEELRNCNHTDWPLFAHRLSGTISFFCDHSAKEHISIKRQVFIT